MRGEFQPRIEPLQPLLFKESLMKTTGNHPNSRLRRHVQRVGLRIILSVAFFDARYRLHLRRTCLHLSHKGLLPNSSGHVGVGTLHRTPQAISVFLSKPLDKDLEKLVSAVLLGLVCSGNMVGGHHVCCWVLNNYIFCNLLSVQQIEMIEISLNKQWK